MSQMHCSLNGQLITGNNQAVDLFVDRGLAYGHGLFETVRFQNAQLPLLERHLLRLNRDAKTLGISIELSLLDSYLNHFLQHLKSQALNDGVIKIIVTAGVGGLGYQSPQPIKPSIIFSYSSMPPPVDVSRPNGTVARYCHHRLPNQPALAGIKHLNRLDQVIARREWDCANYDDGLMFNEKNQLIEAISANIFLQNAAGDWLTPCLKDAGVSGVMRSLLLDEIFPACQMDVEIRAIEINELIECQQLFLCNSVRGLMVVTEIYGFQNELQRSLSVNSQMLMLIKKLTEMYPCF